MIDLDRAEALLRGEGLKPWTGGITSWPLVFARSLPTGVRVSQGGAYVLPDGDPYTAGSIDDAALSPDEADALAAALTRAAALCRRIEAECRAEEKGG